MVKRRGVRRPTQRPRTRCVNRRSRTSDSPTWPRSPVPARTRWWKSRSADSKRFAHCRGLGVRWPRPSGVSINTVRSGRQSTDGQSWRPRAREVDAAAVSPGRQRGGEYRSLTTERPVGEGRFVTVRTVMRSIASIKNSSVIGVNGRSGVEDQRRRSDAQGRVARLEGEVRVAPFRDAVGLGALARSRRYLRRTTKEPRRIIRPCASPRSGGVGLLALGYRARLAVPVAFFAGDFLVAFFAASSLPS